MWWFVGLLLFLLGLLARIFVGVVFVVIDRRFVDRLVVERYVVGRCRVVVC